MLAVALFCEVCDHGLSWEQQQQARVEHGNMSRMCLLYFSSEHTQCFIIVVQSCCYCTAFSFQNAHGAHGTKFVTLHKLMKAQLTWLD